LLPLLFKFFCLGGPSNFFFLYNLFSSALCAIFSTKRTTYLKLVACHSHKASPNRGRVKTKKAEKRTTVSEAVRTARYQLIQAEDIKRLVNMRTDIRLARTPNEIKKQHTMPGIFGVWKIFLGVQISANFCWRVNFRIFCVWEFRWIFLVWKKFQREISGA
jgi:hypothetical protein